jgi:HNH endonuclease
MPRPRSFTDDDLRTAVQMCSSLHEVSYVLDLTPGGRTYESLRRHIRRLGIDASHLPAIEVRQRTRKWTDDRLREVVRESRSMSEVLRRLGYVPSGGMYRYVNAKVQMLGIDRSHFTGQAWSRGVSCPPGSRNRPLEDILVVGSMYPSGALRKRLVATGIKQACCEICGLDQWRGQPLSLALDHINGDPTDNRLENLRILCPNCHAQTDTWCRRNVKRAQST